MAFDAKKVKEELIVWVRDYFKNNASEQTKAVIGVSGGKDSTVSAALLAEALGKDRVYPVLMPQGEQFDIDVSRAVCEYLGIEGITVNIEEAVDAIYDPLKLCGLDLTPVTTSNTPARIRMAVLYAIAGSIPGGGRVVNNCNLSETYVGYSTKFGDAAGDFSLLCNLTVTEVKALGYELGLPAEFIEKVPIDGLQDKTDEDNLGFTYAELDEYIRNGSCHGVNVYEKIAKLHKNSLHKLRPIPAYDPDIQIEGKWEV